jgi:hypothetical protein
MGGRQISWTRLLAFWLDLLWPGALEFSASTGVFVAFRPEWLPCGVTWLSSGLGGMMHFVQGSGQQSPPTTYPLFPSAAPTVRFRPRYIASASPKDRLEGFEIASD